MEDDVFVTATAPKKESDDGDDDNFLMIDIDDAMDRLGMGLFQYQIVVACGLCFASDAMEILLLSFLAVILQSEWDLSEAEADSIVSIVFVGALVGTLCLSPLGDKWGRKPVFAIIAGTIGLFGILTAVCNTYYQILAVRFMVGVGVGGLTVPYDALGEFMPSTFRGPNMLSTSFFWTAGSLLVPLFAWWTLGMHGHDHWRIFVAVCALPCLVSMVLGMWWLPESPRWLLTRGKHDQALRILREAAAKNGIDPRFAFPEGMRLVDYNLSSSVANVNTNPPSSIDDTEFTERKEAIPNHHDGVVNEWVGKSSEHSGRWILCSNPQWRKISLLLGGQWYGLAFMYYGTIRAVSIVFSSIHSQSDATDDPSSTEGGFDFDYVAFLITSSAEAVGLTLAILMVNRVGRVSTQCWSYSLGGFCILLLGILDSYGVGSGAIGSEDEEDVSQRGHLIVLAFLSRMFIMAATSVTWLHTAELLPTEIRATGHGLANTLGRIGGITCPYIISRDTPLRTIGLVMFLVGFTTSMFVKALPETTGKALGNFDVSLKDKDYGRATILTSGAQMLLRRSIDDDDLSSTEDRISKGDGKRTPDKEELENTADERSVSSFELV